MTKKNLKKKLEKLRKIVKDISNYGEMNELQIEQCVGYILDIINEKNK